MPRRDGTGPMGQGAMTGRGMGICNGGAYVQYGYGFGNGRGLGLNCRRGYLGDSLKEQKEFLERRLEEINNQLDQPKK